MYAIIYNVVSNPRERMVVSAALLIRERGAQATAISDVLEAQRRAARVGLSLFPRRPHAAARRGDRLRGRVHRGQDRRGGERRRRCSTTSSDDYRQQLIRSDYRAGCPIVAVTVEAGDPDNPERTTQVIERAAAAFALWTDLIGQRLMAEGVTAARAEELAMLVTTSIEGAIVVARASRDVKPLDLVQRQLRALLQAETAERKSR